MEKEFLGMHPHLRDKSVYFYFNDKPIPNPSRDILEEAEYLDQGQFSLVWDTEKVLETQHVFILYEYYIAGIARYVLVQTFPYAALLENSL